MGQSLEIFQVQTGGSYNSISYTFAVKAVRSNFFSSCSLKFIELLNNTGYKSIAGQKSILNSFPCTLLTDWLDGIQKLEFSLKFDALALQFSARDGVLSFLTNQIIPPSNDLSALYM